MKICSDCKQNLPETDFSQNPSKQDGLNYCCKRCSNAYARNHYLRNKQKYIKKARKHNKRYFQKYWAIKSKEKCSDCGISFPNEPWLMEYDHIGEKSGNVSHMARFSPALARKEIEKCEPVCVLCHRRRTAKRGGWKFNAELVE